MCVRIAQKNVTLVHEKRLCACVSGGTRREARKIRVDHGIKKHAAFAALELSETTGEREHAPSD